MNWRPMTDAEAHAALRLIDEIVHVLTTTYDRIERGQLRNEEEAFVRSMTWDEFLTHLNDSVTAEP